MHEETVEILHDILEELKKIKYVLSDISEQNSSTSNIMVKRNNEIHELNLKIRRFELESLENSHV